MTEILEPAIDDEVPDEIRSDDLKLLIEWPSRWDEFVTSLGPALKRSPRPLAGEAPIGEPPYRTFLFTWAIEALLLLAIIFIPAKLAQMRPYKPPPPAKYDVIYYSNEEMPRMEDRGGTRRGLSGQGGGSEAHHRTQTIRVAREETTRPQVVDPPRIDLPRSDSDVANMLAFKAAMPPSAPTQNLKSTRSLPSMNAEAVAPTPEISRDKLMTSPHLSATVVPPAPSAPTTVRMPGMQLQQVVPPPVSAPERATDHMARLTLPTAVPVAPAPQISREMGARNSGLGNDLHKQVVPPPVQVSGSVASSHNLIGLGNSGEVVPPMVSSSAPVASRRVGTLGNTGVVPPPVDVHPPGRTLRGGGSLGDASSVVAPAPSASELHGTHGSGSQTSSLPDAAALAPKASDATASGVVISAQPGAKVAVPNASAGSLALSPLGTAKSGLGGSSGSSGVGHAAGAGAGLTGEGSGLSKEGSGRGADALAKAGSSTYTGSGGAGNNTGEPAVPGVSVHGGSANIVTLPSFGSAGSAPAVSPPSHSGVHPQGPGITIVATSRSGGALAMYGALKGDEVYTIYVKTSLGTAVMQYADPTSSAIRAAQGLNAQGLSAPQPIRTALPADLPRTRLVISYTLDRSGALKAAHVLDPAHPDAATQASIARALQAIGNWKFSPAMRGTQPVEVNAILGFGIDTR